MTSNSVTVRELDTTVEGALTKQILKNASLFSQIVIFYEDSLFKEDLFKKFVNGLDIPELVFTAFSSVMLQYKLSGSLKQAMNSVKQSSQ